MRPPYGRSRLLVTIGALAVLGALLAARWVQDTQTRHDTWDRMQARGTVRVGMDASYPPFGWVDESGVFYGFDVALARALAERWGVEVEFVNVHFDGLYDALYTGRVDLLLSALPYDQMLTRDVRYSQPYFGAGQVLLVREGEADIVTMRDLGGGTVAVELGATAHQLARTLDRDHALGLEILPYRELVEAVQATLDQEADALLCDRVSSLALVATHPLRIAGEPLTDDPFVIAVRPNSPRLLREINGDLDAFAADGTLDELSVEWLLPR